MDLEALEEIKNKIEKSEISHKNHRKRYIRIKEKLDKPTNWHLLDKSILYNDIENLYIKLNYKTSQNFLTNFYKTFFKHSSGDIGLIVSEDSTIYPFSKNEIKALKYKIITRNLRLLNYEIVNYFTNCFKALSGYIVHANKKDTKPIKPRVLEEKNETVSTPIPSQEEVKNIFQTKNIVDIFGKECKFIDDSIVFWDGENIPIHHYKKILSKIHKPKEICYVSKNRLNYFQNKLIQIFNMTYYNDHEDSDEKIKELIREKHPKHIIIISSDADFIQISKYFTRKNHQVTFISNSNNFKRIFMTMDTNSNLLLFK